jgi:hypothetical protein
VTERATEETSLVMEWRGLGSVDCTRLFVLTLGYGRQSVRLLTFASSRHRWAEFREEACRGGG